jgi:hypothetical protein
MKAEHRKELETNVLADKMGRMVQRIKTKPQRRSVLYFLLGLVVLVVVVLAYRLYVGSRLETTSGWIMVDKGDKEYLYNLAGMKETEDKIQRFKIDYSNPSKAASFQVAHHFLWDQGIHLLGADHAYALSKLRFAEGIYKDLQEVCKGDPVWHPEALYNLAIIQETYAVQDQGHLKKALKQFEELAATYKDSGYGQLAEKRAKQLRDDEEAITKFYRDLQTKFRIPEGKELGNLFEKLEKAAP